MNKLIYSFFLWQHVSTLEHKLVLRRASCSTNSFFCWRTSFQISNASFRICGQSITKFTKAYEKVKCISFRIGLLLLEVRQLNRYDMPQNMSEPPNSDMSRLASFDLWTFAISHLTHYIYTTSNKFSKFRILRT